MLYTVTIFCTPFVKHVKNFASSSWITFGSSFLGATEVAVQALSHYRAALPPAIVPSLEDNIQIARCDVM
jgi:hypothetical protein